MANYLRGEAEFRFTDLDGEERIYTLNYNNQAKMSIEADLNMTRAEIVQRFLNSNGEADQIRFVLLRHGFRKHHRNLFKSANEVHDILEEFDCAKAAADDRGEALRFEFVAAVMSAYDRQDKNRLLGLLTGDIELDEEEEEAAKSESKAPKPKAKPEKKPTKEEEDQHLSVAGSDS